MNPIALAGSIAVLVALALAGYFVGQRIERTGWLEQERERVDAFNRERWEQSKAADRLQVEVEALRRRPERVRTIVKEVVVHADADCKSLPDGWRRLWNAAANDRSLAAAAAVGDADGMPVAGDDGDGKGDD